MIEIVEWRLRRQQYFSFRVAAGCTYRCAPIIQYVPGNILFKNVRLALEGVEGAKSY